MIQVSIMLPKGVIHKRDRAFFFGDTNQYSVQNLTYYNIVFRSNLPFGIEVSSVIRIFTCAKNVELGFICPLPLRMQYFCYFRINEKRIKPFGNPVMEIG